MDSQEINKPRRSPPDDGGGPRVFVVAAEDRAVRRCLRLAGERELAWAYLGQSIEESRRAESHFDGRGARFDTAGRFHQAAEDLRDQYLSYVYDIGRNLDSLRWWVTSIAYRRREVSKTFHQACYLKVALDLAGASAGPGTLVLVVADLPVRRALMANLPPGKKAQVRFLGPLRTSPSRAIFDTVNLLARRAYFIAREGRRILVARWLISRAHVPVEPTTLLVSSLSQRSFNRGAEYHTYFFGDLAAETRAQGRNVATVPLVLRNVSYGKALQGLRGSSIPVMVPHRYLSLFDVVWAAVVTIPKPPQPRTVPWFAGMDITPLFHEDLRGDWTSNRAADVLVLAASIRHWAAQGASIERIVYVFENQPWERGVCWQTCRSFPDATLVGYQHARVPRMLLSFYLASGGESEAPLPHRLVTVGEHTARLLSADGHDPDRVRVGGAFQMLDLFELRSKGGQPSPSGQQATVLVACSEGLEETAELASMAVNLFEEEDGIQVVLKFHPVMPYPRVAKYLGGQLPGHVTVSQEPIIDLMFKSTLMLYTGTTVCMQALVLELPVVHVRPQFEFDFDPLEGVPAARLEAVDQDSLLQGVRWLLEHRDKYVAEHRDLWHQLVEDYYSPITEQTYRAFLD